MDLSLLLLLQLLLILLLLPLIITMIMKMMIVDLSLFSLSVTHVFSRVLQETLDLQVQMEATAAR